jgi:DNA-entry nuclease
MLSLIIALLLFFVPSAPAEDLPPALGGWIPLFVGLPIWEMDGPFIDAADFPEEPGVFLSPLDDLGRPGPARARLNRSAFPTAPRSSLSGLEPAGWQWDTYEFLAGTVYNRSHLIGNQLCGIDAIENIFTGTAYLNQELMAGIENSLYFYLDATGNTVLYAVTPIYDGDELVPQGILIEAQSLEDDSFVRSLYLFNCQPGVCIDYSTGETELAPIKIRKD